MRSFSLLTALVLGLSAFVRAKSSQGDDVLVILDPKLNRDDYSLFFGGLESEFSFCRYVRSRRADNGM